MKKDYLKEKLSDYERTELISIIFRVAKKYKLKLYNKLKREMLVIDELDLRVEDTYNFDESLSRNYKDALCPLNDEEKDNIVKQLNILMKEVRLCNLKKTLTYNEKLVFFLIFIENQKV